MSQASTLDIKGGQNGPSDAILNMLPCRIHHTGPVNPSDAYWNPETGEGQTRSAYFRGRKLQGKTIPLPESYRGVVIQRVAGGLEGSDIEKPEVIAEGSQPKAEDTHVVTEFKEMVVWSRNVVPDASSDPYLRSVEEWLQVAEQRNPEAGIEDGIIINALSLAVWLGISDIRLVSETRMK